MNDAVLRKNLVELLQEGQAHITAEAALENLNPKLRNVRPASGSHSVWEELEHMRITQEDILRYTLDAAWVSPEWPEGYWPRGGVELTEERWSATVSAFFSNLAEVVKLAQNPKLDLTAQIPHGEGRTYLRQILLVADHNAYHMGQIVQIRKLLGDWSS
jgi:uncharacterized damage-inducible protein DinB